MTEIYNELDNELDKKLLRELCDSYTCKLSYELYSELDVDLNRIKSELWGDLPDELHNQIYKYD